MVSTRLASLRAGIGLAGAGLLLAACAYDPNTGTYVPCCAAAPGAYAAPSPTTGPAAAESAGPVAPETYPPAGYAPAPGYGAPPGYGAAAEAGPPPAGAPDSAAAAGAPASLAQRFAQANVSGDGRLTLEQAQTAGWRPVARWFAQIDVERKGYVTLDDIRRWKRSRRQTSAAPAGAPGYGGQE